MAILEKTKGGGINTYHILSQHRDPQKSANSWDGQRKSCWSFFEEICLYFSLSIIHPQAFSTPQDHSTILLHYQDGTDSLQ